MEVMLPAAEHQTDARGALGVQRAEARPAPYGVRVDPGRHPHLRAEAVQEQPVPHGERKDRYGHPSAGRPPELRAVQRSVARSDCPERAGERVQGGQQRVRAGEPLLADERRVVRQQLDPARDPYPVLRLGGNRGMDPGQQGAPVGQGRRRPTPLTLREFGQQRVECGRLPGRRPGAAFGCCGSHGALPRSRPHGREPCCGVGSLHKFSLDKTKMTDIQAPHHGRAPRDPPNRTVPPHNSAYGREVRLRHARHHGLRPRLRRDPRLRR